MTDQPSPSVMPTDDPHAYAAQLMRFIDASPTPWHAVANAARALEAQGFVQLDERQPWALHDDGRYYVVRGGSIVAFRTGTQSPREAGFRILGAHTDSPNLRVKPKVGKAAHGHAQLELETYGGLLLATWADRDLGVAGRVFVRTSAGTEARLVQTRKAVCRIPNVAIHLNRKVNDEGLVLNKHRHISPVTAVWAGEGDAAAWLQGVVADLAQAEAGDVLGHDLCLFDVQPGGFVGLDDDYISIGRLDNLGMSYGCLTALLARAEAAPHGRVIALYDHEEVGSTSAHGADSSLMNDVLGRLAGDGADALPRAMAASTQVSADMAHALHPNYADLHDGTHMPRINAGPVIKSNVNQRYATDGETSALFRLVCKTAGVPFQEFVNRPDLACGSTIGPITASRLGVRTVDVGNPMWGMHSIREMAGAKDPLWMHQAMATYLSLEGL